MSAILLKNRGFDDAYARQFAASHRDCAFVPLLEHQFVDGAGLAEFLASPAFASTDAVIITSQRAIEAVSAQFAELTHEVRNQVLSKPVFTVGPASAANLKSVGYTDVRGGAEAGNGDKLADIILAEVSKATPASPLNSLVFFTGETRRDAIPVRLRAANIPLVEKVVYRTTELPGVADALTSALDAASNEVPWIVFFSPANTQTVVSILQSRDRSSFRLAAIGPTTERHLNSKDLDPDAVAASPQPTSLIDAINAAG